MGYQRKALVLEFEDEEFKGLEIRCKRASVELALGLVDVAARLGGGGRHREDMRLLLSAFAGCPDGCTLDHKDLPDGQAHYLNQIQSWNLEDDAGSPIEPGYSAVVEQDLGFAMAVSMAWFEQIVRPSGPLGSSSNSGGPSEAEPLPMAPLPPDGLLN